MDIVSLEKLNTLKRKIVILSERFEIAKSAPIPLNYKDSVAVLFDIFKKANPDSDITLNDVYRTINENKIKKVFMNDGYVVTIFNKDGMKEIHWTYIKDPSSFDDLDINNSNLKICSWVWNIVYYHIKGSFKIILPSTIRTDFYLEISNIIIKEFGLSYDIKSSENELVFVEIFNKNKYIFKLKDIAGNK